MRKFKLMLPIIDLKIIHINYRCFQIVLYIRLQSLTMTQLFTLLDGRIYAKRVVRTWILTRGGIAVGQMVHNQEIAFGPALVEAVELEQTTAIYPRVIMTDKSYQKIDNRLKQNGVYAYPSEKQSFDNLLVHYKNELLFFRFFVSKRRIRLYRRLLPTTKKGKK